MTARPTVGRVAGPGPVLARRLTAQLLAGPPAADPVAVAERLLSVQAQDPRGARLAIRARAAGVTGADVDRELTETRSLLVTWLNRGTLHLVRSEDYPWLHQLLTPPLRTSSATRLAQNGVDARRAERGVAVIDRALSADGPLTRHELRDRLASAGLPTEGQALIHLLYRASVEGVCVRGPVLGRQHAYVHVGEWLPPPPRVDRDRALAELARRYLQGHGPASDRDFARWAGLPLRDVRAGLKAIAPELEHRPGQPEGLVDIAGRPAPARLPAPRLLGSFEPVLLGWISREDILGPHAGRVVTGGVFRSFALAGGRGVANWSLEGDQLALEPFGELSDAHRRALERDAVAVRRFLGLP